MYAASRVSASLVGQQEVRDRLAAGRARPARAVRSSRPSRSLSQRSESAATIRRWPLIAGILGLGAR